MSHPPYLMLVTNADASIAASGRSSSRIVLTFAAPEQAFLQAWPARLRALRSPALLSWRHELRCSEDGEGVDASLIDERLGALGVQPPRAGQRGLFGRGLRWRMAVGDDGRLWPRSRIPTICVRRVVSRGWRWG